MKTLSASLEQIIDEQVNIGIFKSKDEVVRELLDQLIERDIDGNIAKGVRQIEDGQGIVVDSVYKEGLRNRLLCRLQQHAHN